jgi:hypothetical protein
LEVHLGDLAPFVQAQRAEELGPGPAQAGAIHEGATEERGTDQDDDENELTHGRGLHAWAHAIIDFDLSKQGGPQ